MKGEDVSGELPRDGGGDGLRSGGLEDLIDAWWSRYCPSCKSRHPMSEQICPEDGAGLRDLSVSAACSAVPSGEPPSSSEYFGLRPPRSFDEDLASSAPPSTLGGKWRIEARQGGGAFGAFFVGNHTVLEMRVGIKILRPRFTSTEAGRRLFHQEAMRVSRLNHPNIVKVLDYGQEGETPYLVMEYLTGKPLHRFLSSGGLTLEERIEVVRQAAIALIAAHGGSGTGVPLIHLDMKPEHIFLEKIQDRWHVKVIDFGLAEIFSIQGAGAGAEGSKVDEKRIAGTFPYMAPERWRGVVDPRCDIYSLGVILYELISGRRPFEAGDPSALRKKHESEVPRPPSSLLPKRKSVSLKELDSVVLRCLEKDPEKRPQSAEVLAQALERWLSRPRLTTGQRFLRATAVPALVMLLTLGALYWFSGGKVILGPLPQDPMLSPARNLPLTIVTSGPGYDRERALLILRREGELYRVQFKTGSKDSLVTWENVQNSLGDSKSRGSFEASISVKGWVKPSVTSEPFNLILDGEPPDLEFLEGAEEETGKDGKKVLWMIDEKLTIDANELLDVMNCSLNDKLPDSTALQKKSEKVQFTVPRNAKGVRVVLQDLAGNQAIHVWEEVKWEEKPKLKPVERLLTNQADYRLEVEVSGKCGKILIDGEEPVEISRDEKSARFKKEIKFPDEKDRPHTKKLAVKLWSELSLKKGRFPGEPDEESSIEIAHLSRKIEVITESPIPGGLPSAFKFIDGSGVQIPSSEMAAKEISMVLDDGANKAPVRARIEGETGKLIVPEPKSLKGKLEFKAKVRDVYNNELEWDGEIWDYVIPPEIKEFGLNGEEGSEKRPLLNKECPLRIRDQHPSKLKLQATPVYLDPAILSFELRINDSESKEQTLSVKFSEGQCEFDQVKLLESLHPGKNDLFLVASDQKHRKLISKPAKCAIWYHDPLKVEVLPLDDRPLDQGQAMIMVTVMGLKVKGVKIDGVNADGSGASGSFRRPVEIRLAGPTTVDVQVQLEGGYNYKETRQYCQKPVEGVSYKFSISKAVGDLELQFYLGDETGGGFWYTSVDDWEMLVRSFMASKDQADPGTLESGVSWWLANEIAHRLTEELRNREPPLLGPKQSAVLPNFHQLTSILKGLPPQRIKPGVEWLLGPPVEDGVGSLDAAFVERTAEGMLNRWGGDKGNDRFPFRLILPASGDMNQLKPLNAQSAVPLDMEKGAHGK